MENAGFFGSFPFEHYLEPARLLPAALPRGPLRLSRTRGWPLCAWESW